MFGAFERGLNVNAFPRWAPDLRAKSRDSDMRVPVDSAANAPQADAPES
jgi:hypothetical protein